MFVISVLNETEYNTTDLEAILAELKLLLEEVQSTDANSTNATQIFVDLKSDAIEITKDFRDTLKELIDGQTLEQLRERIKQFVCEQVQNLTTRIQNGIRQYNRNQLHRVYNILGEKNESLLNNYQNCTVTMAQVKNQIYKIVNQMSKEKRYNIFSQIKQYKIQSEIQSRICVQNATEGFKERKENRLTNRLQYSDDVFDNAVGKEMENRIRNRMNEDGGNAVDDSVSGGNNADSGSDNNNVDTGGGNGNSYGGNGEGNTGSDTDNDDAGSGSGNNESGNGNGYGGSGGSKQGGGK